MPYKPTKDTRTTADVLASRIQPVTLIDDAAARARHAEPVCVAGARRGGNRTHTPRRVPARARQVRERVG